MLVLRKEKKGRHSEIEGANYAGRQVHQSGKISAELESVVRLRKEGELKEGITTFT